MTEPDRGRISGNLSGWRPCPTPDRFTLAQIVDLEHTLDIGDASEPDEIGMAAVLLADEIEASLDQPAP